MTRTILLLCTLVAASPLTALAVTYRPLAEGEAKQVAILAKLDRAVAVQLDPILVYRDEGNVIDGNFKKDLKSRLKSGTFAVGRYTYTDPDTRLPGQHVFYARSGPDFYEQAPLFNQEAIDDLDPSQRSSRARAYFRGEEASIDFIDPTKGNDAELKIARSLEYRMKSRGLPSGGELKIWVSQPPCPSCQDALEQLENLGKTHPGLHGPKIKVIHVPKSADDSLRTFTKFKEQRLAHLARVFDANAAARSQVGKAGGRVLGGCP